MARNEAETRADLIDPALVQAGWTAGLVDREHMYRPGRLRLLGEQTVRDEPQYIDYVLRESPRGFILAALEAKDESHSSGAGLQQALAYATDVGAPFALATNGHGVVEQDLRTGMVRQLAAFPSPEELLVRFRNQEQFSGPKVVNRRGETVGNPILEPAFAQPGALPMRYYQERAVSQCLAEILKGRQRCLLTLATGTGKTFIAFTLTHKLLRSGYAKKVLFLADRVSLRDQAYNEFWALGERRAVVSGGRELPLQRDVHFAIYQGLWAESPKGGRVYQDYSKDYFDVVIVDECHRSGYGDWGAILDHFDSAFHIGLTATPKRDDSIDTYAFFGAENLDADGNPSAIYEYSLGQGMDDGFLATYKVLHVETNIDQNGLNVHEEVEKGAELITPEGVTPADVYQRRQFEREIVVPDRTRVLCEHLAGVLRRTGVDAKTMIFCVTQEHADMVRQEMQRLLGSETGKNLFAARIVSEERDGQALLEQFQDSNSTEPVVVTTVDLLTTGVNAPAVRNIVFMKPIGSTTVFKQIIGRGSRLDATTKKTFFRIIDYTNATRLLDSWDTPPKTKVDGPTTGDERVAGRVVAAQTQDPLPASVSLRLSRRLLSEIVTGDDGEFAFNGLPAAILDVYASSPGYAGRAMKVDSTADDYINVDLHLPRESNRVRISGIDVSIGSEIEVDLGDGHDLKPNEYLERAKTVVLELAPSRSELHNRWTDRSARGTLKAHLATRQVTAELLELVLARPDADEYDLLARTAFDCEIPTREQRARAARPALIALHPDVGPGFVDDLLDKYRIAGIDEVATAEVFAVPPFSTLWGGLHKVVALLGGTSQVGALLSDLSNTLYSTEFDA
ncbi:DEAD/DEAH box helicase family protein [Rhodococcus hoagii]|nr:DEAD/DEAH box helicase family protein [Prescottella equi]